MNDMTSENSGNSSNHDFSVNQDKKNKNPKKNTNRKTILILLIGMIILVGVALYVSNKQHQSAQQTLPVVKIDGTLLDHPRPLHPFNLSTSQQTPFTLDNLKGHWSIVFFGFTNCGYVCPTSFAAFNTMYMQLQKDLPEQLLPQVVFVSVDPERDTFARIDQYVKAFNTHFIGLRGSDEDLHALAQQMSVAYAKVQSSDNDPSHYMINHSSEAMLIDPSGALIAFLSFPHQGPQMATDYKNILKALGVVR